jgi:hypothetical protein
LSHQNKNLSGLFIDRPTFDTSVTVATRVPNNLRKRQLRRTVSR